MKEVLLGLLCLSGWTILSCQSRSHYFHVPTPMTWTEAQTYCREKNTDLATVEDNDDMSQLLSTVSSHNDPLVWIGLYSKIKWKWSDGYKGSGAAYRSWQTLKEPDFANGNQFCVEIGSDGLWWDESCSLKYPFICYTGTQQDPSFVFVNQRVTWHDAQKHCRENFVDLAIVRNDAENKKIQSMFGSETWAWIGLHRDPFDYWSDGTNATIMYWANVSNPLGNLGVACGAADVKKAGNWRLKSCAERLPFVCKVFEERRQLIKLRIKPDRSVDLNIPAVREDLLRKLQDQLREKGLDGFVLTWKMQPDGKVVHTENKSCGKNKK